VETYLCEGGKERGVGQGVLILAEKNRGIGSDKSPGGALANGEEIRERASVETRKKVTNRLKWRGIYGSYVGPKGVPEKKRSCFGFTRSGSIPHFALRNQDYRTLRPEARKFTPR